LIDKIDTICGFVATIGRPNAGKSSLLNWLVGEKINMVSAKANATRKRQNTIVMHKNAQIVFIDTPGLHQKEKLLNQYMLEEALKAIGDCDLILLILYLAPVTDKLSYYEKFLELNKKQIPHILLLTKIDTVKKEDVYKKINEYQKYKDKFLEIIPISTKGTLNKKELLDSIIKYLPKSPYLFDTEILTTTNLRDIYKEFIREALYEELSDEIPYESDVIIDEVKEKTQIDVIKATIVVEKKSQKGMVIGKGAKTIKRIGKNARAKIQKLLQKQIFLELFVKVIPKWSKTKDSLKEFGYEF